MTREQELARCEGKKRFGSFAQAMNKRAKGNQTTKPYHCPVCGFYHRGRSIAPKGWVRRHLDEVREREAMAE